ncbi:MAG TPA: hypothetical protein VG077_12720 [Verrucomicrobiae bacterium]|nr:hypothetical protein [Verrucomicrobiae bacterium]
MSNDQNSTRTAQPFSSTEPSQPNARRRTFGRRTFMKRLGLAGAAALPAGGLLMSRMGARAAAGNSQLTSGDVAILRFLAAAEILETDLWQQYTELALGNEAFQRALEVLDGDMPTYVNQNTRDEFTHQNFINHYLMSKGHQPVSLEPFRTLPSSQATGANKAARRLTNLLNLTVDTSWFLRYRLSGNPDFGDTFPQIVNLQNVPAIPAVDLPLPTDPAFGFQIQLIANTAGFHFATIEQGGSSLYQSFLPKASSLEVLKIIGAIGGTEIMHFQTWQDKAGNAPELVDNQGNEVFPQLPIAPDATPDGVDHSDPQDTNQIMPAPCKFISPQLPLCSAIRPVATAQAGAQAAIAGLTASGLFNGQNRAFFNRLAELAEEADEARREG